MRDGTGLGTWGIAEEITEPAAGQPPTLGPGVKIGAGVVGQIEDGTEFPAPRDWSISLHVESLSRFGLLEPPRVLVDIGYGTGAGEFSYSLEIPAVGMVWHVAAQWASLRTRILAPVVLPPASSLVTLAIVPGSPHVQYVTERYPYGFPGVPAQAVARAPQFAVAVAVSTIEWAPGPQPAVVGTGDWIYSGPTALSVQSAVETLAIPAPAPFVLADVKSQGTLIPGAANAVRLTSVGAQGWHHVQWAVQS